MVNEKHLIYKEDLLNTVLGHFGIDLAYLGEDLQFCQEAIDFATIVDAVEVTRCENCDNSVYGEDCPEGRVWCKTMCRYMKNEGYCSFGEVKG